LSIFIGKANNKVSELAPTTATTTNEAENDMLKDQRKLTLDNTQVKFDPVANFLFALNSPEKKAAYKKGRGFLEFINWF
jgi:hypothetical protein